MVPLQSCIHVAIGSGHKWSLPTQAQMVLLHLGTDGPLHSGTDGPFLNFFFSQALTVLLVSGTDGPVCGQPIYNYINK